MRTDKEEARKQRLAELLSGDSSGEDAEKKPSPLFGRSEAMKSTVVSVIPASPPAGDTAAVPTVVAEAHPAGDAATAAAATAALAVTAAAAVSRAASEAHPLNVPADGGSEAPLPAVVDLAVEDPGPLGVRLRYHRGLKAVCLHQWEVPGSGLGAPPVPVPLGDIPPNPGPFQRAVIALEAVSPPPTFVPVRRKGASAAAPRREGSLLSALWLPTTCP